MAREALILDEKTVAGTDFAPLPAAWYNVEIEEVEAREVKSGKNEGKEMYNYKLKVVGGDHDGRFLFVNACLWKEAIFTQVNIQQATGLSEKGDTKFQIADEDDLVGKEMKVRVIQKDKYVKPGEEPELDEEGNPVKDNEVKSFKSINATSPAASKGGGKAKGAKTASGDFSL